VASFFETQCIQYTEFVVNVVSVMLCMVYFTPTLCVATCNYKR